MNNIAPVIYVGMLLDQPGRWRLTGAGETHTLSAGRSGKGTAIEIEVR